MDASAEARIVELAKTRPECSARKTNGNKPLIDPVESPRTAAAYDPVKLVDEIRQHKARIAQLEADSAAKDELILRLRKSA
jgi:hypothetical protein